MIQNHLTFKVPFLKRGFNNITDILETLSFLRNRGERSQTTSSLTIYSSTRFSGHRQSFFSISKIGKKKSQQKLAKNTTQFELCSKNLTHFTNLNSLNIEKNMHQQQSQKPFSLFKFSSKQPVGVRKNICTGPFLDVQELHSRSTLKANVCVFLYISVKNFLFERFSKLLSGWGRLNNFLKGVRCLYLVKCFTIFHFN